MATSKDPGDDHSFPWKEPEKGDVRARRGFAAMDTERLRVIASKGGKAAHVKGTAHEFDSEEARLAGKKGGAIISQNREHMAEIGRRGGATRIPVMGKSNRTSTLDKEATLSYHQALTNLRNA